MAIIHMAASAGAALIALMAIAPTISQAQGPGAPLQLVPGPNQAKSMPRPAINSKKAATPVAKAPGKATTKAAARTPARQNTVAAQPAPKAARTNSRPAANSVASSRRDQVATNAQRARRPTSQRATRTAAVPYLTATRPVLRRGTQEPPVIARGPNVNAPEDRVMRGRDSVSLVGMLPWWRNDRMQAVNYGSTEAESKVLEAAAVWLAANAGGAQTDTAGRPAPLDEAIEVADADEVNEIDLAAEPAPGVPTPTFLQSLLALIGGAAVAAAASARLLFA